MERQPTVRLWGPMALVFGVVALLWLAAGALVWYVLGGALGPALFAAGVVLAAATLVGALSTMVRLSAEGIHRLGRPTIPWADVTDVEIEPKSGLDPSFPVLYVRQGRGEKPIDLDGLGAYGKGDRMRAQASEIAARAGLDAAHEVATAPPAQARRGL